MRVIATSLSLFVAPTEGNDLAWEPDDGGLQE